MTSSHSAFRVHRLPGSFVLVQHVWNPLSDRVMSHASLCSHCGSQPPLRELERALWDPPSPRSPGSTEMADSRMPGPPAVPPRLTIASIGMKHAEKNYATGTQILPGKKIWVLSAGEVTSLPGSCWSPFSVPSMFEIVDLRPLKDAGNYPDVRGCRGVEPKQHSSELSRSCSQRGSGSDSRSTS